MADRHRGKSIWRYFDWRGLLFIGAVIVFALVARLLFLDTFLRAFGGAMSGR